MFFRSDLKWEVLEPLRDIGRTEIEVPPTLFDLHIFRVINLPVRGHVNVPGEVGLCFLSGWRIRKKYFLVKNKEQPKERYLLSWVSTR